MQLPTYTFAMLYINYMTIQNENVVYLLFVYVKHNFVNVKKDTYNNK